MVKKKRERKNMVKKKEKSIVKKKERNLVRDQQQLVFVFRDLLVLRHHSIEIPIQMISVLAKKHGYEYAKKMTKTT